MIKTIFNELGTKAFRSSYNSLNFMEISFRVESPRLDSHRYSLINLEETLEHDLDAILGELCTLGNHLVVNYL